MSDKQIIQERFHELEHLIAAYIEDCTSYDSCDTDYVYCLADEIMGNLVEIGIEGSGSCPCCGDEALPQGGPKETPTNIYSSLIVEHNKEEKSSRATLYINEDIEMVGDWEEVDDNDHPALDVLKCLKSLTEKLELKHGNKTDAT